jgi:hypothetical protein
MNFTSMYDHIWRYPHNEWKANPYANLHGQKAPGLLLQNLKLTSDETLLNSLMEQFTARRGDCKLMQPDTAKHLLTFASAPLKFYPK